MTIRPLQTRSTKRGALTETVIRDSLYELSNAINNMALQWNENVYPLVGSLPSGPLQRKRQDRSGMIDPVKNGVDGSQLFMDMTATPYTGGGRLHDGNRQRTIKEVVENNFFELAERIAHTEALIDNLGNGSGGGTEYDDTELRNWILQLAADTVSDLAQGETYSSTNFDSAPPKTAEYSLHQRDVGLRNVIGIEAENFGFYDIQSYLIATTYIAGSSDILKAMVALDAAISAVAPAAVTLDQAYINGDTININGSAALETFPVQLSHLPGEALSSKPSLVMDGSLAFMSDAAGNKQKAAILRGNYTGGVSYLDMTFDIFHSTAGDFEACNDVDNIFSLNSVLSTPGSSTTLRLGVRDATLTDPRYAALIGGATLGSTYGWKLEGLEVAGAPVYRFYTAGDMDVRAEAGDLFITSDAGSASIEANQKIQMEAGTSASITANNGLFSIVSTLDGIHLNAATTLDIDAPSGTSDWALEAVNMTVDDFTFQSNSYDRTTTASANWTAAGLVMNSSGAVSIITSGAASDLLLQATSADVYLSGIDVSITSADGILAAANTTMQLLSTGNSELRSITGDVAITSTDGSLALTGHGDTSLLTDAGYGLLAYGAPTSGLIATNSTQFSVVSDYTVASRGMVFRTSPTGGTTYGYIVGAAANKLCVLAQSKGDVNGIIASFGAVEARNSAYQDVDAGDLPSPYTMYRDNVIKARGRIEVTANDLGVLPVAETALVTQFNLDYNGMHFGGSYSTTYSSLTVQYATPLDATNDKIPAVTASVEDDENIRIFSVKVRDNTRTGCRILISMWDDTAKTWVNVSSLGATTLVINMQAV